MEELLEGLPEPVELGKMDKKSPDSPQLKDNEGVYEHAKKALKKGFMPAVMPFISADIYKGKHEKNRC